MASAARRVVVAGTAFGRIYLDAIAAGGEAFRLAGVLARGSAYSEACAAAYGVPLYTHVAELPADIEILCVVVRSSVTGGSGAELAGAALERGLHVLEEHPVHKAELLRCLGIARRRGVAYSVNTLYPNVRAVRQFLSAAALLRTRQPLRFLDAACNSQVLYPLLDVLGRAAGSLRPWSFDAPAPNAKDAPFTTLTGSIASVPLTLRVQNQVHPADPDNHSFFFHRLAIGCDAGVLTLADTHGPVLWNPRLHAPRDGTGRLVMKGPGTERLAVPSTVILGDPRPGTYHEVFARTWPDAVSSALHDLALDIDEPSRRAASGQWALGVAASWQELTEKLGIPCLIFPEAPEPLAIAELEAAAEAGLDLRLGRPRPQSTQGS